jgi:hypothetical protein
LWFDLLLNRLALAQSLFSCICLRNITASLNFINRLVTEVFSLWAILIAPGFPSLQPPRPDPLGFPKNFMSAGNHVLGRNDGVSVCSNAYG